MCAGVAAEMKISAALKMPGSRELGRRVHDGQLAPQAQAVANLTEAALGPGR